MLVLSRRLNEKLVFPAQAATIQVVALHPTAVRLGIEAPPTVPVFREEIYRPRTPASPLARSRRSTPEDGIDRITAALALLERQLGPSRGPAIQATLDQLNVELALLRQEGERETPEHEASIPRAIMVAVRKP